MNHVLIQHYRSGADFISEHADKTIDVVRGTDIVNVSIGAQRTMTLRTKKKEGRETERIVLPHASMFALGPDKKREWLYGINHDNLPSHLKLEEVHEDGERISPTFRQIGTFLTKDGGFMGKARRGRRRRTRGRLLLERRRRRSSSLRLGGRIGRVSLTGRMCAGTGLMLDLQGSH
jgi:hypothetical protein